MSSIQINTTQNVNISFELAGLGERLLAGLVDYIVLSAYLYFAFWFFDAVGPNRYDMDKWSYIALQGMIMLPAMLYTLLSEIFLNGQTLGKKLLKIQVVKIDGYSASFSDYFWRWMLRIVDIWSFTPIVGIISIISSKNSQRIGDLASGTSVISIKNRHHIDATILENIGDSYQPTYPTVIMLTDRDAQIVKNMFITAKKSKDFAMIEKLRKKVEETTQTSKEDKTDQAYLSVILKDYMHYTQNM